MVNRTGRVQLANALQSLAAGAITMDMFLRARPQAQGDYALPEIALFAESLFGDRSADRVNAESPLSTEESERVHRCTLFLQTNLEYKWPNRRDESFWGWGVVASAILLLSAVVLASFRFYFFTWIMFGLSAFWGFMSLLCRDRFVKREYQEFQRAGETDYWPFLTKDDHESALGAKA